MKSFRMLIVLLCAWSSGANAALEKASEPKEFKVSLNPDKEFKVSLNHDTEKLETELSYVRLTATSEQLPFDDHIFGPAGRPLREVVTFWSEAYEELGALTTEFSPDGRLQKQELRSKSGRILQTHGPMSKATFSYLVPGSGLSARYFVSGGKIRTRVLSWKIASRPHEFTSFFDEKGRRVRDKNHKSDISYFFDRFGLSRATSPAFGDDSKSMENVLKRDANGKLLEMRIASGGELNFISRLSRDARGKTNGMRMEETYHDGVLWQRTEWDEEKRKVYTQFAPDGRVMFKQEFNADGTIKSTARRIETSSSDGTSSSRLETTPAPTP